MKLRIRRKGPYNYECFECEDEFTTPFTMSSCPSCGEDDAFYLMD